MQAPFPKEAGVFPGCQAYRFPVPSSTLRMDTLVQNRRRHNTVCNYGDKEKQNTFQGADLSVCGRWAGHTGTSLPSHHPKKKKKRKTQKKPLAAGETGKTD